MRTLVAILIAIFVLLALLVVAVAHMPAIGDYSRRALERSIEDRFDAGDVSCGKTAKHSFQCFVSFSGSDGDTFRLRVHGDCWDAKRRIGQQFPAHRHGCVKWRHQLRPVERLLGRL